MISQYEYDRDRLQKYLPQLRGCAGLSAEALGQKLGITKQAVNAIEKRSNRPLTKMQYICIRAVFDEECSKNPDNINLRDCYDLVFSEPDFYKKNIQKIEYAMHQAVEDTKIQKRKNRAEAKKNTAIAAGTTLAGATTATIAIGGIAATIFPLVFPVIGVAATGAMVSNSISKEKEQKANLERASNEVKRASWLSQAFEAKETNTNES